MDILVVALVAFFASSLTLFSGFGLGTILMPAFALMMPVEVAIAATAVVHLANNLFKLVHGCCAIHEWQLRVYLVARIPHQKIEV